MKSKVLFYGRKQELKALKELVRSQNKVQLVVCYGRRRIGKSHLIREFGRNFNKYIEIQGLAPSGGMSNQDQIQNFLNEFNDQMNLPKVILKSWREAFQYVSAQISTKKCVLFLDEISWMANYDHKFVSVLKQTFDTEFQKNKNLVLVLCGSVSSWISDNILNSTDFVGRISLDINLKELSLNEVNPFFSNSTSLHEKLLFLLYTGGVPRYLVEYRRNQSVDYQITQMAFKKSGLLFQDFDRIFSDIFQRRTKSYKQIILTLKDSQKRLTDILKQLDKNDSGKYSEYLKDLVLSGFIRSYKTWDLRKLNSEGKITYYRLIDNYLRFYLKQIETYKKRIENDVFEVKHISNLKNHDVFLGFQFENLILNNTSKLFEILNVNSMDVINFGPYVQVANTKQKGCQIDFLIQTKFLLYVVEIKYRKNLKSDLIQDFKVKINNLKKNKSIGIKKVLIHSNEVDYSIHEGILDYFDQIVSIEEFFEA